jgi:DNA topoisomerase IB
VGTDAGRRQYPYHERFRAQQEQAKHEHVREVARALPTLRERVAGALAGRARPVRRTATHGLTTMLREHVTCGREELPSAVRPRAASNWSAL